MPISALTITCEYINGSRLTILVIFVSHNTGTF